MCPTQKIQIGGISRTNNKILINLPNIENCKRIFQSIAMLDTILMPEWEYRYYSFNSKWYLDEMMASMRDGSGQRNIMKPI